MDKTNELIGILEEQLRFIKMTVTEREYLKNTVNKLKEAINYSQCCKSDSEQLCDHKIHHPNGMVERYNNYCLKCNTALK